MNNVVLGGRLTKDVELDFVGDSQVARARFTLAIDRDYRGNNSEKVTDFINLEIWGNRAQAFAPRLKKGIFVLVEGSIRIERYSTDEGKYKSITKIQINSFKYIENKSINKDKYYNSKGLFEDLTKKIDLEEETLPF